MTAAAVCVAAALPSAGVGGFIDVNPNSSDLDTGCPTGSQAFCPDPDGASGGRTNGLASSPGNNQTLYAATEWGGIYKTTDGGQNWSYLQNHLPQAAWDVQVDPSNANRVYATSFFDGRTTPLSGINVSTNAGSTWTHPPQAFPANSGTYNCPLTNRAEPSSFGIAIEPGATNNVYVGTNCGLAISSDSGGTWTMVDPKRLTTPAGGGSATIVWDVVAQAGGTVDVCGNDGHLRSTDRGVTWTASTGLPTGTCSIVASPDEGYVLFVNASDSNFYETDDADAATPTWTNRGTPDSTRQGRFVLAATNQRADTGGNNVFDLWFGDVRLFRAGCTTPATRPSPDTGGSPRCPAGRTGAAASPPPAGWAGPFTRTAGSHDDTGEIVFDPVAANDKCPILFSNDGGVYRNTDTGADCQNPDWSQPNRSPHSLWLFAMAGANQAGDAAEDLHFGTQDDGFWTTTNAGAGTPTWSNKDCCDVFDVVADPGRVVWDVCCGFTLFTALNNLTSRATVATNPPGTLRLFNFADLIDSWTPGSYIAVSSTGGFTTTNITAGPVTWTQLGSASTPGGGFCGVQAAVSGGTPTFYAQTTCIGGPGSAPETQGSAQLWQYVGTGTGATWTQVDNNDGLAGGFGMFAVDPNNPNRLYASNLSGIAGVRMVFSTDGGTNWEFDPELDSMMTGSGSFLYQTQTGPTNFSTFNGYEQPTLVAYDPENSNIIVAGGRDSGVFLSTNSGEDWTLLTDQTNPGSSGKKLLTHPFFAYFDHEPSDTVNIYVGTRGHGIWRISLKLPVLDAFGPFTTNEGQDATLTASATDPDSQPLTFTWDLDNDGQFDDGTGTSVSFTNVGQDGVFPVRVKVTDTDGGFDVAESTVTVNNVSPTVTLASDSPKPENTAVTVTGTISDPGWLDPLSATIDWDDGSAPETISGTLENDRPDATLKFSIPHTYGDNGTFDAEVCGSDDDSTVCETIALEITNVDPTAVIDESGTVLINGVPTFIAHVGVPITFNGRSQDPGSDDLTLTWDWDDGAPAPDETTAYLNDPVNFPLGDPFPSPTINPRDVTDSKTHAFANACFYEIVFASLDDDAGTGSDKANVIITGNADATRSAGYWYIQYRLGPGATFTPATLQCYLDIVGYMSLVFNEVNDASTLTKARQILATQSSADGKAQLDRQLLAAWLNFANGSLDLSEMVDTDGKKGLDTTFYAAVMAAEAVRLNPASTKADLLAQAKILERINLRDE